MYQKFFGDLNTHLEAMKAIGKKMDSQLAHRFNILEFLRRKEHVSEMEFSRILADLLDPNERHGQGILFLHSMLEAIAVDDEDLKAMDLEHASVSTEYPIQNGRLDIHIDIPSKENENRFCLAIENKPYAADGENQIGKYLKWLKDNYEEEFELIYLSGNGEKPAEGSLPEGSANCDRLKVMAYDKSTNGSDADRCLTKWLTRCRQQCEAEKVRFFLADLKNFIQQTFGNKKMENERVDVGEWLLGTRGYLETARLVYQAWPEIRDQVCQEFLDQLYMAVKENLKDMPIDKDFGKIDVDRGYEYKQCHCRLWIYRDGWPRPQDTTDKYDTNGGACVRMENNLGILTGFWLGVWQAPYSKSPDHFRQHLQKSLPEYHGHSKGGWWHYRVDNQWLQNINWEVIIEDLHCENQENAGSVHDRFVKEVSVFARKVMPHIDEWFRQNSDENSLV